MSRWYRQVTADMSNIVSAISHFETEIEQARLECGMKGVLEKQARDMPGIVEQRFNQLHEVEAHSIPTPKCEKFAVRFSGSILKVIIEHSVLETLTDL